jgi:hypothetical protein
MNKLEEIQNAGPSEKTPEGYEKWYDMILGAANAMLGRTVLIEGELDVEMAETVGTFNPYTRQWESSKHEKLIDLTEELK